MACANPRTAGKYYYVCEEPLIGSTEYKIWGVQQSDGTLDPNPWPALSDQVLQKNLTVFEVEGAAKSIGQYVDIATDRIKRAHLDGNDIDFFVLGVDGNGNWDGIEPTIDMCTYPTAPVDLAGKVFGNAFNGQKDYKGVPVKFLQYDDANSNWDVIDETVTDTNGDYAFTGVVCDTGSRVTAAVYLPQVIGGSVETADLRGYHDPNYIDELTTFPVFRAAEILAGKNIRLTPAMYLNEDCLFIYRCFFTYNYFTFYRTFVEVGTDVIVWFVQNKGTGAAEELYPPQTTAVNLDDTFPISSYFYGDSYGLTAGYLLYGQGIEAAYGTMRADLLTFLQTYLEPQVGWSGKVLKASFAEAAGGFNLQDWQTTFVSSGGTTFNAARYTYSTGYTFP